MSPAISIVGNVCRAWVASADEHSFAGRLKVAAFLHFFVGLCGMFFLILMGPWMTAVLFGAEFAVGIDVMVPIGVYFFLWSLETVTSRHMLANMGGISHLYLITLTISIPGACALLVAGRYSGAVGGAWVLASVMATLVVSQAIAACTLWGRPETSTNP
ncbi:hypothetical protein NOK12_12090 [Nocardioides sp. OK12]|nr:hypothetical protein NOK12_12090 [Nocardioides sp. OK12]